MNYIVLGGGWVIYFALHSLLATDKAKGMFRISARTYRLWYSIISTFGLIGLLVVNGSIPADNFFGSGGVIRYFSLMFTTFGVMTIQLSFRRYSIKSFLGLKKEESQELKFDGILKHVRHPIYAGLILITIGFFLFIPNLPTLVSCMSILVYIPIGMYLEEKKLMAQFGEQYQLYKEQVPAIIPRLPLAKS